MDEMTERKKWDERESKVWSEEKLWWEVLQQIHSYVTVEISICSISFQPADGHTNRLGSKLWSGRDDYRVGLPRTTILIVD